MNKKRIRLRLLAVLPAFAAMLVTFAVSTVAARSDTPIVKPVLLDDWGTTHAAMVADAKKRADSIKVVFAGDSITARWTTSPGQWAFDRDFAPVGAINLGIPADGSQHLLWRLQHDVLTPLHPKMVILMIGANDLGAEPDAIAYGVWTIVSYLRTKLPDARVLVQGILPRDDRSGFMQKASAANALIAKLDDGKMVKYIYFGDQYLNAEGAVNTTLLTDRVHPNTADGFKIWDAAIMPTVKEWLAADPVPNVAPPPSPVPAPANLAPATRAYRNDFLSRHNRVLGTSPAAKAACQLVLFGGEDMSCWDRQAALFAKEYGTYHALNFALWGARPENILWQIDNGELDGLHPKLIVLHAQEGLRDPKTAVETIAAGIGASAQLALQKCPTAKVLVVGANPLGATPADVMRTRTDAYNALLAKLADGKSVFYLDAGKAFLDADGKIVAAGIPGPTNSGDAVFSLWASAMRDEVVKLAE